VTGEQLNSLRDGQDIENVFSDEQRAVNAQAMDDYRNNKDVVYRAEMKFFFGRDLTGREPGTARLASHEPPHGAHPPVNKTSGGESKCPFSRLFGSKKQEPTVTREQE
jgi:hypothetical protein